MFKNCSDCLFYNKTRDDMLRELDDELPLDGITPNNHFCYAWKEKNQAVIPQDIWTCKNKCPYYLEKSATNDANE